MAGRRGQTTLMDEASIAEAGRTIREAHARLREADVPSILNGRQMTLVERVAYLARQRDRYAEIARKLVEKKE